MLKHRNDCDISAVPVITLPLSVNHDLVNQAIFLRLIRVHKVIAFGIPCDFLNGLAGILRKDFVQLISGANQMIRMDLDICCLEN